MGAQKGCRREWDYVANRKVLDKFFTEGMERAKDTEDLITIGMRGDGDAAWAGRGRKPNTSACSRISSRTSARSSAR